MRESLPAGNEGADAALSAGWAAESVQETLPIPGHSAATLQGTLSPEFTHAGERGPAVSSAIRQKIFEHKYVDLNTLIDSQEKASDEPETAFQLVNGVLRAAPRASRPIGSFGLWCAAFIRFSAVYVEAYPEDALGLMQHMYQVSQLNSPGLCYAWRVFDQNFRKGREIDPVRHRWGETANTSQMWLQAIAQGVGGATRSQPPPTYAPKRVGFRRPATTGYCYKFNQPAGCSLSPCIYPHNCRLCRGPHSAMRCTKRQQDKQRARPQHNSATRASGFQK